MAGTTSRSVGQYLIPRIERPFNLVVQAHTHAQSWIPVERKFIIESGCLAATMDYWRRGKLLGKGKLTTIGYASGYMRKGKAIINECRPIFKAWEDYI